MSTGKAVRRRRWGAIRPGPARGKRASAVQGVEAVAAQLARTGWCTIAAMRARSLNNCHSHAFRRCKRVVQPRKALACARSLPPAPMACSAAIAPAMQAVCKPQAAGSVAQMAAAAPIAAARRRPAASAQPRQQQGRQQPQQLRRTVLARAELEEVDPMTGEVISGTAMASDTPERLEAGGFTWAYRKGDVNAAAVTPGKMNVRQEGLACRGCVDGAGRAVGSAGGRPVVAVRAARAIHPPRPVLGAGAVPARHRQQLLHLPQHRAAAGRGRSRGGGGGLDWARRQQQGAVQGPGAVHGSVRSRLAVGSLTACALAPPRPLSPCPPLLLPELQPTSGFDYTAESYVAALNAFVDALGWRGQPFAVIVQGYVLGQVRASSGKQHQPAAAAPNPQHPSAALLAPGAARSRPPRTHARLPAPLRSLGCCGRWRTTRAWAS